MLVPLRAATATTTYDGLYGWILGGLLLAVGVGFLGRLAGVPQAISTVLCTAGCFALLIPFGLWFLAWSGEPGTEVEAALLVGLPAAGISMLVALVVLERMRDAAPLGAGVLCVVGFVFVAAAGDAAWGAVRDAREDAVDVAQLEMSGLSPYLPDIEGLDREVRGLLIDTATQSAIGVTMRFGDDLDDYDAASISVDLTTRDPEECTANETFGVVCRSGSGYTVSEYDGEVREVAASIGGGYLIASFTAGDEGTDALPDADAVGAALADAELVEWQDILDLRD